MAHHLLCLRLRSLTIKLSGFIRVSVWFSLFKVRTGGLRLIHSPVGGHSFLVWGVKKKAAMNIYVQVLCGRNIHFSWVHTLVTNFCITDPPSTLNLGAFRQ